MNTSSRVEIQYRETHNPIRKATFHHPEASVAYPERILAVSKSGPHVQFIIRAGARKETMGTMVHQDDIDALVEALQNLKRQIS